MTGATQLTRELGLQYGGKLLGVGIDCGLLLRSRMPERLAQAPSLKVCYGSLADITEPISDVRSALISGHGQPET
jgi:hypothetical protein